MNKQKKAKPLIPKLVRIAINDTYEKAGGYEYLKKKYNLLREDILNKIKKETA